MPRARLEAAVGEADAQWLRQLAAGVDLEEVKECRLPQSVSCGKTFRGPTQLRALPAVHRWLLELGKCGPRPCAPARAAGVHSRLPGRRASCPGVAEPGALMLRRKRLPLVAVLVGYWHPHTCARHLPASSAQAGQGAYGTGMRSRRRRPRRTHRRAAL